mgnify:FL=1
MASTSRSITRRVEGAVARWPGVTVRDHRFDGREFRLGAREVGHLHDDRRADVAYPRPVRDAVVEAGLAGPHHLFPDSGWVTYPVDAPGATDCLLDLLRLSYLVHAAALARRGAHPELDALDVPAELDALGLPAAVTAAARARLD